MYIVGKAATWLFSICVYSILWRALVVVLGCSGGGRGQHGTDCVAQNSSDLEFFSRIPSILLMHPYHIRSRENDYPKEKKAKK